MISPMRIIAGTAGRMRIQVPASVTRPTTDFVRQALFSMLAECIEGARVLDLFAGSGAMGLEALSRGAASCNRWHKPRADSRQAEQGSKPRAPRSGLARWGRSE